MSFSEVRSYSYGDDIRNIDWNVSARTGEPYVKLFEEERELSTMLLIDVSASNLLGTGQANKQLLIAEIAATLAFSAVNNNDKVGAILFTDKVVHYLPLKKGKAQVLLLIRTILQQAPLSNNTHLTEALQMLNGVIKKKCIAFIISDFLITEQSTLLRQSAKRHDVNAIHVTDNAEQHLLPLGLIHAIDFETRKTHWIDTNNNYNQAAYKAAYHKHITMMQQQFASAGAQWLSINPRQEFSLQLHQFFQKR
jgi:uncharacterized protein (DUF58 family)